MNVAVVLYEMMVEYNDIRSIIKIRKKKFLRIESVDTRRIIIRIIHIN